jgi:hypothetical protein
MTRLALALVLACLVPPGGGDDESSPPDAGPPDAAPPDGTFTLTWTIEDEGGDEQDCDAVGAVAVTIDGVPIDAVNGFTESFGCDESPATSLEVDPATYTLEIDLRAEGGSLLDEPVRVTNVEIASGEDTPVSVTLAL